MRFPLVIIIASLLFNLHAFAQEMTEEDIITDADTAKVIGMVNGVPIMADDYEERVAAVIEAYEQDYGSEIDEQSVRQTIWENIVDEALIKATAKGLGITISDADVYESLLREPPQGLRVSFIDSLGILDQARYKSFIDDVPGYLRRHGSQADEIARIESQMDGLREVVRQWELERAVKRRLSPISESEAYQEYAAKRGEITGAVAALYPDAVPDSAVRVTAEEARHYFESHKEDFQQRAARELRYAWVVLTPLPEDIERLDRRADSMARLLTGARGRKERDAIFEGFVDEYGEGNSMEADDVPLSDIARALLPQLIDARPGAIITHADQPGEKRLIELLDVKSGGDIYVRAQQVYLKVTEGDDEDSVKALAQEIARRAKGGESFAALVRSYTADEVSKGADGDVGYFTKGEMVLPFEQACFKARPGEITGPIRTELGYHIAKVTDRSTKRFKLRDVLIRAEVTPARLRLHRERAEKMRAMLAEGVAIDTVGAREGVKIMTGIAEGRMQPIIGSMRLTNFAYESRPGEVSSLIELPYGDIIVAQLVQIRAAGTMQYADAEAMVLEAVRTAKKLDILMDRAVKLRARLRPGDDLKRLSALDPAVNLVEYEGASPHVVVVEKRSDSLLMRAIMEGAIGEASPAIRGRSGCYIIYLKSRTIPTREEFLAEDAELIESMTMQLRDLRFQEWLEKERNEAVIVDHRTGIY